MNGKYGLPLSSIALVVINPVTLESVPVLVYPFILYIDSKVSDIPNCAPGITDAQTEGNLHRCVLIAI
jgi:hypothetical protein